MLIVLLVGIAGGFYIGTYKNALVKKSARDLFLAAKYARILAIERQNKCWLKLDPANNSFMLFTEEFNEESEQTEKVIVRDLYFKPVKFAGDVKFENIHIQPNNEQEYNSETENTITFSPDGTALTAVVQIGDGKNHLAISISGPTGKVKIYESSAEDVKSDTIDLDKQ